MMMTFCMACLSSLRSFQIISAAAHTVQRLVEVIPVLGQLGKLRPALRGQLVVLTRWTGIRFLPLVVDRAFAPHFAQERSEERRVGKECGCVVGSIDFKRIM